MGFGAPGNRAAAADAEAWGFPGTPMRRLPPGFGMVRPAGGGASVT